MLFGQFNLGTLYRQTIHDITTGLPITAQDRKVLFTLACLADIKSGVCMDPETERPATIQIAARYGDCDTKDFLVCCAALHEAGCILVLTDKGKSVAVLADYLRFALSRIQRRHNAPLLLVRRKTVEAPQHLDRITPTPSGSRAGWVYIAYAENGLYKIGKARDPRQRVRHFAGAVMPFGIEFMHAIYSDDMHQAESYVHQQYAVYRRVGEWFDLPESALAQLLNTHVINVSSAVEGAA